MGAPCFRAGFCSKTIIPDSEEHPLASSRAVPKDVLRWIRVKDALRQIIADIERGARVSEAFSHHTDIFPEFYLRLLRVGESTGGLPSTLRQLTENLQRRKKIADSVKKALTYPALSLGVAFVAAFVLITYSLPALTSLLREFGGEMPLATRLLIMISDALRAYTIFVIGPVVGLVALTVLSSRSAVGRKVRDRMLLTIPGVRGIISGSNMFYLTTTLSTLLRAGMPSVEALRLTQEGLTNAVFREGMDNVTRKASEGTRLGQAFSEEPRFSSIVAQAIVTGEMQGNLSDTLGGLADYYEDLTDRAVSGATEMIQPAVILIVAAVVGFVAVAVISGIYATLGSIG